MRKKCFRQLDLLRPDYHLLFPASHAEVRVDRLERWYRQGLLVIGDAAHAMSPVDGVGIDLAIQDGRRSR